MTIARRSYSPKNGRLPNNLRNKEFLITIDFVAVSILPERVLMVPLIPFVEIFTIKCNFSDHINSVIEDYFFK